MGEAIGRMLPTAVGVALSPLPIVAVVLMLVVPRGRVNGPAFILGWWLGLAIVGVIVLSVAGAGDAGSSGAPATWVSWLELILGALLLLVAMKQWRGRPASGEEPPTPKWMGALDGFTPVKAAGAGALLSGLNPKNLLLAVAGGITLATAGLSGSQEAISWAIFILIASIGVGTPVVIYFALGARSRELLDRLKPGCPTTTR
jgi:threonine/homoserine/homoserine lactone efflux protein